MAILSSNKINHPKIEAIFTVQEETTMEGAKNINLGIINSKKMICLDNMNEEELWIGCACAKIFEYEVECAKKIMTKEFALIRIGINGFMGGHSGKDISKNRGNPIKEMGNLLERLFNNYEIYLKNIHGGRKVNVIPRECYSEIYIKYEELKKIYRDITIFNELLKNKKLDNSENIMISVEKIEDIDNYGYNFDSTKKIIDILNYIKNGVYYEDKYGNPLVSLNIGKIENKINKTKVLFSIRSNRDKIQQRLEDELNYIVKKYQIQEKESELPGYEHKEKSIFVDKCKTLYKQYFNRNPRIIDMHICLEAGFFGEKIPNLDFIAIAPNIYDAHSPKERCSISSLKRIYNYIVMILESL